MHAFRLFDEDNISEHQFRGWYEAVEERAAQCSNFAAADVPCEETCDYLIAFDIEATRDGLPSVFGLNCDVEVVCWGGHADETTEVAQCRECAARQREIEVTAREARQREEEVRLAEARRAQAAHEALQRASADYWKSLNPLPFEAECAQLFMQMGFLAATTARTNDCNIDITLERDGRHGAAQCKAWGKPCGVSTVREFLGTMHAEELQFGYLIAKSGFTRRANVLLKRLPGIQAWDLQKLVDLSRLHASPVQGQS